MYKHTCTCTRTKKDVDALAVAPILLKIFHESSHVSLILLRVHFLHQLLVQLLQMPIPFLLPSLTITIALLDKYLGQTMEVE